MKNYDLLSVLLICPGKPDSQDSEGILRLLGVLLSSEIKSNDKKKLLEQEFQIEMNWSVQDAMDALCDGSIFHTCSLDHRCVLSFVRCHRDLCDLWFLFNVLFCNFIDGTVCVFRKAAFHDPGKDDLLCQKTFAGFF